MLSTGSGAGVVAGAGVGFGVGVFTGIGTGAGAGVEASAISGVVADVGAGVVSGVVLVVPAVLLTACASTQDGERYDKAKTETVTRPGGYSVTSRSPQCDERPIKGRGEPDLG